MEDLRLEDDIEDGMEEDLATTSIMHNFIVSNPESVAKFAKALEEAANDPPMPITVDVKFLDDPDEIRECMEKLDRAIAQRNSPLGEQASSGAARINGEEEQHV